jgi:hypothetical protein
VFAGDALVAHILEGAPSGILGEDTPPHILILYITYKCKDGLRYLRNSHNAAEVMAAFSYRISVRTFTLKRPEQEGLSA